MEANIAKDTIVTQTIEPAKHAQAIVDSDEDDALAVIGLRPLDDAVRVIFLLVLVTKNIPTTMEPNDYRSLSSQHFNHERDIDAYQGWASCSPPRSLETQKRPRRDSLRWCRHQ